MGGQDVRKLEQDDRPARAIVRPGYRLVSCVLTEGPGPGLDEVTALHIIVRPRKPDEEKMNYDYYKIDNYDGSEKWIIVER